MKKKKQLVPFLNGLFFVSKRCRSGEKDISRQRSGLRLQGSADCPLRDELRLEISFSFVSVLYYTKEHKKRAVRQALEWLHHACSAALFFWENR
jgi:hypothetical protein